MASNSTDATWESLKTQEALEPFKDPGNLLDVFQNL